MAMSKAYSSFVVLDFVVVASLLRSTGSKLRGLGADT